MEKFLSTAELAARLRVDKASVTRWAAAGLLPIAHRSEAGFLFRLDDILKATTDWAIRPPYGKNHKPGRNAGA